MKYCPTMTREAPAPPRLVIVFGSALRRAPYAWLAATVLSFLLFLGTASVLTEEGERGSLGLAVAVSSFIAVNVVVAG